MKLANTLALCLTATMLWNCNESTKPESEDPRVPATVNLVTKHAALSAGFQISSETAQSRAGEGDLFTEEAVEALRSAGLCNDFIQLIEELVTSKKPGDAPGNGSPRLKKVVECFTEESKKFAPNADLPAEAFLGMADKCFCGGDGSIFLRNFAVTKYSAPTLNGYGQPSVSASPYGAPSIPGYSAPSIPGYSAPSL